ncbi:MAG: OmpH family outer membrane protein [Chitinophagaceae bacterium]
MKNGMLIWNVLLSLVAGYLLIVSFGSKNFKSTKQGNNNATDSSGSNEFRIAYFEMDSVAANFEMVKEVKSELSKKEDAVAAEMDRLGKNIQQKYVYYQNLAQAGNLSQTDSESASQELKKLDDDMKARQKQLDQDYFDLRTRRETDIKLKIESFCKDFNKDYGYNYIVSYEQGLFFYKDTAYNITKELVKGLNEKYKPAKAKKN